MLGIKHVVVIHHSPDPVVPTPTRIPIVVGKYAVGLGAAEPPASIRAYDEGGAKVLVERVLDRNPEPSAANVYSPSQPPGG